jgi:hypothetical protein
MRQLLGAAMARLLLLRIQSGLSGQQDARKGQQPRLVWDLNVRDGFALDCNRRHGSCSRHGETVDRMSGQRKARSELSE